MLAGIYYGAQYGGSTTAILINMPGESVLGRDRDRRLPDGAAGPRRSGAGHRRARLVLRRHGRDASWSLFAPPLTAVALEFGPAEYFSLMVARPGLVGRARARLGPQGARDDRARAAARPGRHRHLHRRAALHARPSANLPTGSTSSRSRSACSASPRSCAISRTSTSATWRSGDVSGLMPTPRRSAPHRGARSCAAPSLGSLLGILPGGGASWPRSPPTRSKRSVSSTPERFGKGAIEGVAGPGIGQQCRRADLVHPDADARHSGQPGHGADDRRDDHPGHRPGPERRHRTSRRCSGASSPRCGSAT